LNQPSAAIHAKIDVAIALGRKIGLLRARDFDRADIPRSYLSHLREEGVLLHLGRGLYQYAEAALSPNQSLAGASKRVPHGVM
jgi:hypothetical protein